MTQGKRGKATAKKAVERLERQKRGYAAQAKAVRFERKVGEYVSKLGYQVSYEKPIAGNRFDVFGQKKDPLWGQKQYFIAECKTGERVTARDVLHFMNKLNQFYERLTSDLLLGKPSVKALLAYTGELDKDACGATKVFKPSIEFKKFT